MIVDRQTYTHTDTLITILPSLSGRSKNEVNIKLSEKYMQQQLPN